MLDLADADPDAGVDVAFSQHRQHLIDNARKYAPGVIQVAISFQDGLLALSVRDFGADPGHAAEAPSHGMGLAIVRDLAKANGGGFALSGADPGLCARATHSSGGGGVKILIAEDDPNLRAGLADLLALEGLDCVIAEDGEAAWQAFVAEAPALCLFDVMMPRLDGLDLCRRIRARDARTPILLLSARGAEIDRVIGLEIGADDYIAKPFATRELVARIKAALRRAKVLAAPEAEPKAEAPGRLRMGDLEIDPSALRAWRDGQSIDLAPRELAILQALLARKGKAVTRDELFDLAWGRDYMPNSRALDQYVSGLRRKIEIDPARPRIVSTVHGVGYRYDED